MCHILGCTCDETSQNGCSNLVIYILVIVMLVAVIFNYGQAAIGQQASPPTGIPSADNSTNLRNIIRDNETATPLGIPSEKGPIGP